MGGIRVGKVLGRGRGRRKNGGRGGFTLYWHDRMNVMNTP